MPRRRAWLLALCLGVAAATAEDGAFPSEADRRLMQWLQEGAGFEMDGVVFSQLADDPSQDERPYTGREEENATTATVRRGVLVKPLDGGDRAGTRELHVSEDAGLRNASLAVSLRQCITFANTERDDERLANIVRPLFETSEEYGLALILLHEVHKGADSRYPPFLHETYFPPDALPPSVYAVLSDVNASHALEATFVRTSLDRMVGSAYDRFVRLAPKLVMERYSSVFPAESYYEARLRWGLAWTRHAMTRVELPAREEGGARPTVLAVCPLLNLLPHHPRGAVPRMTKDEAEAPSVSVGVPQGGGDVVRAQFRNMRVGLEPLARRDKMLTDSEVLGRYGNAPLDDDIDERIERELEASRRSAEEKLPPSREGGDASLAERGLMRESVVQLTLARRFGHEDFEEEVLTMELFDEDLMKAANDATVDAKEAERRSERRLRTLDVVEHADQRRKAFEKCRVSTDESLGDVRYVVDAVTSSGPSPQLLCALRVACATLAELGAIVEGTYNPNEPIDPVMEYNAMLLFDVTMERQLEAYAQSDAADVRLLARLTNETAFVESEAACRGGGDTCVPYRPSAFWIRALRVSAREKMLMVEALHAGRRRADAVLPNLRYQNGKKSDESGVMSGAAGYDFRRKYNGVQKSKSEQQQVETVEETKGKKGRGKKGKKKKGGEDERSRDDSSSSPSTTKDEL